MKRITAFLLAFLLLFSGIAAGSGISIDNLDLFANGPLSFLSRFLADSSSAVTLMNRFVQKEGPLTQRTGKQSPKPQNDPLDTAGCLPDVSPVKVSMTRAACTLPSTSCLTSLFSCPAGHVPDAAGPPGGPGDTAVFIPLFLLAFFILLSRSNLPAAAMLSYVAGGPDPVMPGRVFL